MVSFSDVLSIIALCISLLAAYLARKQFIRNNRPFVWAGSGAFPKANGQSLENAPSVIFFRVNNAPAKIVKVIIKISTEMGARTLFEVNLGNLIRHPDDRVQWTYKISDEKFSEIIKNNDSSSLIRIIQVDYKAIDSEKLYTTQMEQRYKSDQNQWLDMKETAT